MSAQSLSLCCMYLLYYLINWLSIGILPKFYQSDRASEASSHVPTKCLHHWNDNVLVAAC